MSNYKDPEKKRQQDANYRRQHWFAIKLKNQVYRRLPHVKERRREYGRSPARKAYYKKYYQEHKEQYADYLKRYEDRNNYSKKYRELHKDQWDYYCMKQDICPLSRTFANMGRCCPRFLQDICTRKEKGSYKGICK